MLRAVHVIGRMPGHGTQRQLAEMLKVAHGRFWDARLAVAAQAIRSRRRWRTPGCRWCSSQARTGIPVGSPGCAERSTAPTSSTHRCGEPTRSRGSSPESSSAPRGRCHRTQRRGSPSFDRPEDRSEHFEGGRTDTSPTLAAWQRSSPGAIGADRAGRRDHQRDR